MQPPTKPSFRWHRRGSSQHDPQRSLTRRALQLPGSYECGWSRLHVDDIITLSRAPEFFLPCCARASGMTANKSARRDAGGTSIRRILGCAMLAQRTAQGRPHSGDHADAISPVKTWPATIVKHANSASLHDRFRRISAISRTTAKWQLATLLRTSPMTAYLGKADLTPRMPSVELFLKDWGATAPPRDRLRQLSLLRKDAGDVGHCDCGRKRLVNIRR
jgi:hypothetical protein